MTKLPNKLALALLAAAMSLPLATLANAADAVDAKPMTATATPKTSDPRNKVEQRIADMHATLKITQAQEGEFDKFAQVMLDNAQAMDSLIRKNAGTRDSENADAMMHDYVQVAQQHAQNVQSLATAFDTLYGTLTQQQKQAADQMFRSVAAERDQKHAG
jgi:leucyl aminopeptidase (aminopeptidase T)